MIDYIMSTVGLCLGVIIIFVCVSAAYKPHNNKQKNCSAASFAKQR